MKFKIQIQKKEKIKKFQNAYMNSRTVIYYHVDKSHFQTSFRVQMSNILEVSIYFDNATLNN